MRVNDFQEDDYSPNREFPNRDSENRLERLEGMLDGEVYNSLFLTISPGDYSQQFSSATGYSKEVIEKYLSKLQKRFLKNRVGNKTYSKLQALLTESDAKKSALLFENLMKKEFPRLKRISDVEFHDGVDRLGLEYFREIQEGYGKVVSYDGEKLVDDRSGKQVEIANKIVIRTLPDIKKIVRTFLDDGEIYAPVNRKIELDDENEEIIKVTGPMLKLGENYQFDKDELNQNIVNFVSQKVIESMHNYLPEVYSMSSFIKTVTKSEIIRYMDNFSQIVRIPVHLSSKVRKEISKSNSREDGVKGIEDTLNEDRKFPIKGWFGRHRMGIIYDSITNNLLDIDEESIKREYEEQEEDNFDHEISSRDEMIRKMVSERFEVRDEMERCLGNRENYVMLNKRNREIIEMYFGFDGGDPEEITAKKIGDIHNLSVTRVMQIVNHFVWSLKRSKTFRDNMKKVGNSINFLTENLLI